MSSQSPTSTKVEVSRKSVPHGLGFSVSAAVSPTGPNRVHGDVEFFVDGNPIGMPRTDSTGVAAVSIPGGLLPAGEHEFTATFHGDPWNASSKSEPVTVMLEPAPGEAWPVKKAASQQEADDAVPPHPDQPQDAGKIVPPANHGSGDISVHAAPGPQAAIPDAAAPLPPVPPNPEAPPPPPPNPAPVPQPAPPAPQPSPATPVPPVIPTAAAANPQAAPTEPAHPQT